MHKLIIKKSTPWVFYLTLLNVILNEENIKRGFWTIGFKCLKNNNVGFNKNNHSWFEPYVVQLFNFRYHSHYLALWLKIMRDATVQMGHIWCQISSLDETQYL